MTDKERDLLIRLKGLLMLAVDLIDRECHLGKYAPLKEVALSPSDSVAGVIQPNTQKGV